jgi:hypothetical protein
MLPWRAAKLRVFFQKDSEKIAAIDAAFARMSEALTNKF